MGCDDPPTFHNHAWRYYMSVMRAFFTNRSFVEQALIIGAVCSGLLLIGAHIFEAFGYPPCELCLDQREAHWTALAVALIGLAMAFIFKARLAAAASVGALALVYALSAGLAFFHTGVEFGFWPGPASCSAAGFTPVSEPLNLSEALTQKPTGPSCGDAAWRLFGISMAGYNLLASVALFVIAFVAAIIATRHARQARRPSSRSEVTPAS